MRRDLVTSTGEKKIGYHPPKNSSQFPQTVHDLKGTRTSRKYNTGIKLISGPSVVLLALLLSCMKLLSLFCYQQNKANHHGVDFTQIFAEVFVNFCKARTCICSKGILGGLLLFFYRVAHFFPFYSNQITVHLCEGAYPPRS